MIEVPVLIVGGGPVGLAMAIELGWRGVGCLVVEQGDGTTDFPITVPRNDFETALGSLKQTAEKLGARVVSGNNKIVKISIVGVGMRSHAGIASRMFEMLAREGINILMISTSEIKISVVVDEKYLELGVRALHEGFDLKTGKQ